jgi:hypothetical protein
MNQVLHIFRKDSRRFGQTIAAVLVFTLMHGYGAVIQLPTGYAMGLSPRTLLLMLASLSGILLPIMLFLLVVSVIQEDSLVGSDNFWLTRPYSRRSLALEKLLFVVVWAFLPMLLHDVILIRYFGFSLSSALGLLLWKNAQFCFFLLVAATLAVLSASFARAILVAIAAVFSFVLIFAVVLQNASGNASGPPVVATGLVPLILALLALAAIGALCVIAFQYRFRIASVAAVIGLIAILVCALLTRFWPVSLSAYFSTRYASPLLRSIQISPDASLTGLSRPVPPEKADVQAQTVYYPFQATGLAGDVGVAVNGISAEFVSPGQKRSVFYMPAQVRFQPSVASGLFADAAGPDQFVPMTLQYGADFKALSAADGTMSGKLIFDGYRSSVVRVPVPMPYKPQHFAVGGRRCSVEAGQNARNLVLHVSCVELEPGNTSRVQVRLLQDNLEIVPQSTAGDSNSQGNWPSFLSPVVRTMYICEFSPQVSAEFLQGELPRDREMLVFVEQPLGGQERSFRIDHFRPADLGLSAWERRGGLRAEHDPPTFVVQPSTHPILAQ